MSAGFNWDDLRFVLAVSESSNLTEAGEKLGVAQTTVSRRIYALEEQLGSKLFEQMKVEPKPTAACEHLIAVAKRTKDRLFKFSSEVGKFADSTSGTIRVTTLDFIALVWAEDFLKFKIKYPEIKLELITTKQALDMSKREADVSIRLMHSAPAPDLVGMEFGQVGVSVYSKKNNSNLKDLGNSWISYRDGKPRSLEMLTHKIDRSASIRVRDDSLVFRGNFIEDNLCLGILPCFYGDSLPRLERVGKHWENSNAKLWLLTHSDISHSKRIKVFMEYFTQVFVRDASIISGKIL